MGLAMAGCMNKVSGCRWSDNMLITQTNDTIGHLHTLATEGIATKVRTSRVDDDTWMVEWSFRAECDVNSVRLVMDFVHHSEADYWMIPAVSYNGNEWGRGLEPKGAMCDGYWRTYSYRRTPIPGALYSEGKSFAVATWSNVPTASEHDFSCSLMPEADVVTHRLIWPEEEMPVSYCNRDRFIDGWQRVASLKRGEERHFAMYLSATKRKTAHTSMQTFLKKCWEGMAHPSERVMPTDEVWRRAIGFCKESLWAEDGIYKGFSIGLLPQGEDGWHQRTGGRYESGWCGQNISIACSMLWDYLKNGDRESLDKGVATLDCWADNCRLPNGLFVTQFDAIQEKRGCNLDACNLGTTALNYFQAYHLAQECGYDRPQYRHLAFDILDFVLNDQQPDGCYARGWTFDGSCIYREGTVGCFLLPAMLEAYQECGDKKYLESGIRAYKHYVKELYKSGYTTAGALDTWCIDKESAISLLRSSLRLYGLTGEREYLDDAIQTSYYLSTWLWHYDGVYPAGDAFTQYGYHTFGGTSVSVQHHHLDYYAALWIPEWVELAELTGDRQWLQKAQAVWNNCCQLISDGTLRVNNRLRPFGSQNEAYFESSWGFGYGFGKDQARAVPQVARTDRINDWLVAWPSAFRLETLRKLDRLDKLSLLN